MATSSNPRNRWLIAAGLGSALVALLHAVIIFVGAPAYRYFGAGDLAPRAEQGSYMPALITGFLVLIFAVWALYAFSGAGLGPRLPLLRLGLGAIATIYTLRGLMLLPELYALASGKLEVPRMAVFSAVSLFIGLCYVAGFLRAFRRSPAPGLAG
ncbi:MAG TPA: hypothetical protein VG477_00505 [Thermoanaerobaculia bacterium]|nr:hypothetical protein [Thermoanaerobaculia bacterium]